MPSSESVIGDDLAARVARVYLAQRSLGCDVTNGDGLALARNTETPLIYDSNFAFDVAPGLAADRSAFADVLAAGFDGVGHQKVVCDAGTAPIVEARLAALGFEVEQILQMVLEGPLPAAPAPRGDVAIHAAETEADWAALVRLQHANFAEKAASGGRAPLEIAVAEQMVHSWRMKAGMRFWLASSEGEPCAYLGSWTGCEGLGMVEYLFTDPTRRHRGIATALISQGVGAVREAGAEAVLIGADVEDTPKQMYLDLGFRPVCIVREWLRPLPPDVAEG